MACRPIFSSGLPNVSPSVSLSTRKHEIPCRALTGAGEQAVEVGDAAVGDPRLGAVDAVAVVDAGGLARQRRRVGTGLRFGQAVGADRLTAQHLRQPRCFCSSVPNASSGWQDRMCTLTATATAAQRAAISSSTCR